MALLTQASATTTTTKGYAGSVDLRLAELDRLLDRLQKSALRASAERQRVLISSQFERNKLSTSVQHARAQLTALERDALGFKVPIHRRELQADLNRKREVVEDLAERLRDLEDLARSHRDRDDDNGKDVEDGEDEDDDDDDILSAIGFTTSSGTDEVIATPSESIDSQSAADTNMSAYDPLVPTPPSSGMTRTGEPSATAAPEPSDAASRPPRAGDGTSTSQALRPRGPNARAAREQDAAATATKTTGHGLFGQREAGGAMTTATTEAILDQQRAEQDLLSESMVQMARSLKESSRAFAASLEEDQAVMARAGEGLNRNELGIEAATRRMGTLRKMTEGEGWWGRMRLYAMVYGLMVILILFVFVMPKLRF